MALLLTAVGCAGRVPAERVQATPQAGESQQTSPASPTGGVEATGVKHVVEQGQTLWRIARVYGVEMDELAEFNGIDDPSELSTGQTVVIPGASTVLDVPPYPAPLDGSVAAADPGPVVSGGGDWLWPVENGALISAYGAPRKTHRHRGIDIRGRHGQKVLASRAGQVSYSGSTMRGYGKTIIVDHGDSTHSLYAHNSGLLVREGQRVKQGQPIARVGASGNASAEHCHFEIRRGNKAVDPMRFVQPPSRAASR